MLHCANVIEAEFEKNNAFDDANQRMARPNTIPPASVAESPVDGYSLPIMLSSSLYSYPYVSVIFYWLIPCQNHPPCAEQNSLHRPLA